MHLHFTVCPPRDDFALGNASPFNEISSKGCIDDKTGIKSTGKNHPGRDFFIRRDEISWDESSLEEDFFRRDEISGDESSLRENFYPQG